MKKLTEINFESWIEQSLLKNGYHSSFIENVESKSPYDKELCSIKESVLEFIKSTQEKEYTKLLDQYGDETDSHLLKKIDNTIQQTDIIHLQRRYQNKRLSLSTLLPPTKEFSQLTSPIPIPKKPI